MTMSMSTNDSKFLIGQLNTVLDEINYQINFIQRDLLQTPAYFGGPPPSEDSPYKARTRDGNYILAPLLAAKAQTLAALVQLKTSGL